MSTFDTIGDEIEAEIQARGSKTRTIINQSIVYALAQLARYRVLFMEGTIGISAAVTTTDGLEEAFGGTPTNFPADIQQIDELWWEQAGVTDPVRWPIQMTTDVHQVAILLRNFSATGSPVKALWHHQKLVFAPKWGLPARALKGYYYRDARRNTSDGALITIASTTQTNGWFVDGALCLKALASSVALANPYLRNEAAAAPMIALYQAEIGRLKAEYMQKVGYSAQAPRYHECLGLDYSDRLVAEGLSTVP